jgi:hypothetical protein
MGVAIAQLHEFEGDEPGEDDSMEGPEPEKAGLQETNPVASRFDPALIGVADDEAREHKEEIDAELQIGESRGVLEQMQHRDMKKHDEQSANAAPRIERPKAILCETELCHFDTFQRAIVLRHAAEAENKPGVPLS